MRLLGLKISPRNSSSPLTTLLVTFSAIAVTRLTTMILFSIARRRAIKTVLYTFFIEPLSSIYNFGEVLIKASPLILIGQGPRHRLPRKDLEHRRRRPAHHRR